MLIAKSGDLAALLAGAQCRRCAKSKDCAVARGKCPYFVEEDPEPVPAGKRTSARRAGAGNERGAS